MYVSLAIAITQAVSLLENSRLKNDEEEIRWKSVLLKLYLNVALCSLKVGKYPVAITNSRKALELDENNVKALFRIGEVCTYVCVYLHDCDIM